MIRFWVAFIAFLTHGIHDGFAAADKMKIVRIHLISVEPAAGGIWIDQLYGHILQAADFLCEESSVVGLGLSRRMPLET